jgi:hypothetical protein
MVKKMSKEVSRSRQTGMGGAPGDQIVKKLTLPSQIQSTTAGAIIPLTTGITSSFVQSNPATEWASFAARYQQFRVRQVRVRMMPVFPVNSGVAGLAVNTGHSQMYVADYIGASLPASAAQVLSDERATVVSTAKGFSFVSTWNKNPNAKLWNPTGAAIPAANLFGIAWASNTNATLMAASLPYFAYDVEWIVEFRGSQ